MADDNKVYVVWWNDGEAYEDNFQDIEAIFATREEAEKYLDANYDRHESTTWDYKLKRQIPCHRWETHVNDVPYTCKEGRTECDGCPLYEDWLENGEKDIPYDEDAPCREYEYVCANHKEPGDYNVWSIREFRLGVSQYNDL